MVAAENGCFRGRMIPGFFPSLSNKQCLYARKAYYAALANDSRSNEVTGWLVYFAETVLAAQQHAQQMVEFLIAKTRFFDRLRGQLNERQEKVLLRIVREGPSGFQGGLSAEKYMRITGTSRATITRDLQDLVDKRALARTGERKGTRYQLNAQGA
jgi:Fic family protein